MQGWHKVQTQCGLQTDFLLLDGGQEFNFSCHTLTRPGKTASYYIKYYEMKGISLILDISMTMIVTVSTKTTNPIENQNLNIDLSCVQTF